MLERLREASADKLRIGPLTDAGITTVGQAFDSERKIEHLPGLGSTAATRICGAAHTALAEDIRRNADAHRYRERRPQITELLRRLRSWDIHRRATGETDNTLVAELSLLAKAVGPLIKYLVVFPAEGHTSAAEAIDITEAELARQVIAEERERLFLRLRRDKQRPAPCAQAVGRNHRCSGGGPACREVQAS
ncbi:hypothetical protein [Nocardia rhamnosiphila]